MRMLLAIIAILTSPTALDAREVAERPGVRAAKRPEAPGPQPSVTIRNLPAPAARNRPGLTGAETARGRKELRRQLHDRIVATRKQITVIKQLIAKTKDRGKRRMLESLVEILRGQVRVLQIELRRTRVKPSVDLR